MSESHSARRNLFWTVAVFAVLILVFFIGKSQKRLDTSLGIQTAVSQDILNLQEAFVGVSEQTKPAVVSIYTEQVVKEAMPFDFFFSDPFNDFFNDLPNKRTPKGKNYQQRKIEGAGSGVIIDKDGYILTNYHVVKDAEKITVKLAGDKEYSGKVIGKDARTDLAVVKIKPHGILPVVKLGDSDKIRVGDWAIAIGSPFGLEQTVTVGIISAKRQNINVEGNNYRDFIQTDASINRGNSGGPLVNINGEVIGINTAIFSQSGGSVGVGFAIPINLAKSILVPLMTKGKVERGFLGVSIEKVDEVIAKQSGLKEITGVIVGSVSNNTAASRAGIKRGDIILEFDNQKIDSPEKLQDIVAATPPNKKINVVILQENVKKTVSVILGEMTEEAVANQSEPQKSEKTAEWLGIKVKQFTRDMAEELNVSPDEQGVVIVEIGNGSKAEEMGLNVGDVIRAINNKKTTNIAEFESATKKISLSEGVLFDINRGGNLIYRTYAEN
ncbi:MAG: Do family serine endopeptidase [Elusimicrobia bacterium]|nr:Do family serine endopeptidase [Elusimicrobiota bacterium]